MPSPQLRCALLAAIALSSCQSVIADHLTEKDARECESALLEQGVSASISGSAGKSPKFSLTVPRHQAHLALAWLHQLHLPRDQRTTSEQLANESGGLIESPQLEQARSVEAKEGDLEEILESISGVQQARVELAVAHPTKPFAPLTVTRAAVILRVPADEMQRLQVQLPSIARVITHAIDGLAADQVSLYLDSVERPHWATPTSPPLGTGALGLAALFSMTASGICGWAYYREKGRRSHFLSNRNPTGLAPSKSIRGKRA